MFPISKSFSWNTQNTSNTAIEFPELLLKTEGGIRQKKRETKLILKSWLPTSENTMTDAFIRNKLLLGKNIKMHKNAMFVT